MKRLFWSLFSLGLATLVALLMVPLFTGFAQPAPAPSLPASVCVRLADDTCTEGLWIDVTDMPTDPYEQCLYLVQLPQRVGQNGLAPELCEELMGQRG